MCAFGQEFLLQGLVKEGTQPLSGVIVSVEGQEIQTQTDVKGAFQLSLPQGSYTLRVYADGYQLKKVPVNLLASSSLQDIFLVKLPQVGSEQVSSTISLSDEELSDEEGSPSMISGLLQSSQELYFRRASFDFSPVYYRPRGYQSNAATVLVNGINMAKVETGRPQWSNWGGLNEATRNQRIVTGVSTSPDDFGGVFGSNAIVIAPSQLRNGLRISGTTTNRNYYTRAMATYNSGITPKGWGYMLSGSYRGGNGKQWILPSIEGMLYQSYALSGAIEYQASPYFSTNLMGIFSYNHRGKSAPLT